MSVSTPVTEDVELTAKLVARDPVTGFVYCISQAAQPDSCPYGHMAHVTVCGYARSCRLDTFDVYEDDDPGLRVGLVDGGVLIIRRYTASYRLAGNPPTDLVPCEVDDFDIEGPCVSATPKRRFLMRQPMDGFRASLDLLLKTAPEQPDDEAWEDVDVDQLMELINRMADDFDVVKDTATDAPTGDGLQVRAYYVRDLSNAIRAYVARRDDDTVEHWNDLRDLAIPILLSAAMLTASVWAQPVMRT